MNPAYRRTLEEHGLSCTGINPQRNLVEVIELPDHPWFVGVQYHPEFRSKPTAAHPLFRDFVRAAAERARGGPPVAAARRPPRPLASAPTASRPTATAATRFRFRPRPLPALVTSTPGCAGAPPSGMLGAPEREGSRQPEGARTAVHSPPPTLPSRRRPPSTCVATAWPTRFRHD